MPGIFISYRQEDSKAWAISLRDELGRIFGDDQVFLDKDTLRAGDWLEQIERALQHCRVALVVIGPRWLTAADAQGRPRIQQPDDVHRREVARALGRPDITVIPVLVDEVPMPHGEHLPADLQDLCMRQARKLGDTRGRRKADLEVLITDIKAAGIAAVDPKQTVPPDGPVRREARFLTAAFVATIAIGVAAYLLGMPIDQQGLFFVLLTCYGAARAGSWLWARVQAGRGVQR